MRQPKLGFVLPVWDWMLGPLRELCAAALAHLRRASFLRPKGVEQIWKTFLAEPRTPIWTRAFALCVLGEYLHRSGLSS